MMSASTPSMFTLTFERACSTIWIVNQVGPAIENWNRTRKPPVCLRGIQVDGSAVPSHGYVSGQRWELQLEINHATEEDTRVVSEALLGVLQDGA